MMNCFSNAYNGKRVLVTGHTGFKGSWLSIWLKNLGAEVIGYSLEPPTQPSNFELCALDKKITHIEGNICDLERFRQVLEQYQPEVVFHLAAQPIVLTSYQDPHLTYQSNVMGTISILEAVRQTDMVKVFVGVTSDKVYKDQNWYWGYRENDALGGFEPYSASKAMTELAIASYRSSWRQSWNQGPLSVRFSKSPVAIASARAGNVIGGGDFADFRILPDFMKACIAGEPMTMRNPSSIRPWQHVLEPLSGYLWLAVNQLQQPEQFNEAWNFGPAEREPVTCKDIIEQAADYWGAGCPGYEVRQNTNAAREMGVLRVNWDMAAYRLSWAPAYSWCEAVEETVLWWKKYQSLESGRGATDMYEVCKDHIEAYMARAKDRHILWAMDDKS